MNTFLRCYLLLTLEQNSHNPWLVMTPDVLRSYKPRPNGQPPAPLFDPEDRLLTIKEAAELSRVDERFISRAARQRQLRLVILRAKNASHSFFKINNSLSIVPYPGPERSRGMFQKALFPLKPDFQKYYQRGQNPGAAPRESSSQEDRFGRKH